MAKTIDILVGDETVITLEGKKFNVGSPCKCELYPKVELHGMPQLCFFYREEIISPTIENQLLNFSSTFGGTADVISSDSINFPDFKDLYHAEIPQEYIINIRNG